MSTLPELVDTHCHLGLGDEAAALVRERAATAGVGWLVDVGIDAATSRAALERAKTLSRVVATAGIHPCDAGRLDEDWDAVERLAADPLCVAVGETGLDFYRDRATPKAQHDAFARHLDLARRLDKPVVVHCRAAFPAVFEVLAAWPGVAFVMHCFSGGTDEARRALDLGGYLSFAGPLTYPKSDALREAARYVPGDRVVVETDSPFLPPQGFRGQRNEPALVRHTFERLAAERGEALDECAARTTANARRLFGLDRVAGRGRARS